MIAFAFFSSIATLHDASKGFHDIKPLPEFFPSYRSILISALLVLAVAYLFWQIGKRIASQAKSRTRPAVDPYESWIAELRTLSSTDVASQEEFRHCIALCSLDFRRCLERLLEIPAAEMTTKELEVALPKALASAISVTNDQRDLLIRNIITLLRSLERSTFRSTLDSAHSKQLSEKALAALEYLGTLRALQSAETTPSPQQGVSHAV